MMKKFGMAVGVISLMCMGAAGVSAQGSMAAPGMNAPPKVLEIDREMVKFGKGQGHEKNEAMYAHAAMEGKDPGNYFALESTTGPEEAWFLELYDSFDAVEQQQKYQDAHAAMQAKYNQVMDQDAQFVNEAGHMTGIWNETMSYNAPVNLAEMRYFEVETIRWRAGHDKEWAELAKLYIDAAAKSKVDVHVALYDIVYGAPQGTVIIFTPHKSIAEIDSVQGKDLKAIMDAMGADGQKRFQELIASIIISDTTNIFAINPKMSYMPMEFMKSDPKFWMPKPMMAPKAAAPAAAKKQ
jgi:hypothetical protein